METQKRFVREVTPRYIGPRLRVEKVTCARDAVMFINKVFKDNAREHFIALYLDASHSPIAYSVISTGTANASLVHPREVFQMAVLCGACAFICAHNHPSGELRPSDEDYMVTGKLKASGELLGIKLLDHLIISQDGFFSFGERGSL